MLIEHWMFANHWQLCIHQLFNIQLSRTITNRTHIIHKTRYWCGSVFCHRAFVCDFCFPRNFIISLDLLFWADSVAHEIYTLNKNVAYIFHIPNWYYQLNSLTVKEEKKKHTWKSTNNKTVVETEMFVLFIRCQTENKWIFLWKSVDSIWFWFLNGKWIFIPMLIKMRVHFHRRKKIRIKWSEIPKCEHCGIQWIWLR